jgi:signal transduction histidine kinase
MALLQSPSPEALSRVLRIANIQTDRLTYLLNDLLDLSRRDAGKMVYRFQDADLRATVRDLAERMRDQAHYAGCELNVHVSDGPLLLRMDRIRLEQVLVNLIGNAIKYAPGNPITIQVSADEAEVKISVTDQGRGISADKHELIFERFGQVSSEVSSGGLGLGLFISKQIVAAHDGSIEVTSTPGQGATFTVRLPRKSGASVA